MKGLTEIFKFVTLQESRVRVRDFWIDLCLGISHMQFIYYLVDISVECFQQEFL